MFEFLISKGLSVFSVFMAYGEVFLSALACALLYRCGNVGFSFGIFAFAYTIKLFADMFWMYFALSFESPYSVNLWYSGFVFTSICLIHCVYRVHLRLGVVFVQWTCIGLSLELLIALLQLSRYIERIFFSTAYLVSVYKYGIQFLTYGCSIWMFLGAYLFYLKSQHFPERIPWKIDETDRSKP